MTKSSIISILLVFILAASTFSNLIEAIAPTGATKNTVELICRSNEDYGFCYTTFLNDLRQPDASNVTLTGITITEAQRNATNTLNFIQSQLLPREKDPTQHMHYTVCQNSYQILQQSFRQAFDAFNQGDYRGMAGYMKVTPRAHGSCTTIFQTPPFSKKNPLSERNREMRILLTMAVLMGSLIAN